MNRGDVGDDTNARARQCRHRMDFSQRIHAHLQHGALVLRLELQERQGQTEFTIEVALIMERIKTLAHDRIRQFLGACLAHAPCDANHSKSGMGTVVALKAAHPL